LAWLTLAGCPELGSFLLAELEALRLPFGMRIERDLHFRPIHPLLVYVEAAGMSGSIVLAERLLRDAHIRLRIGPCLERGWGSGLYSRLPANRRVRDSVPVDG
jgi:hypothetical protein